MSHHRKKAKEKKNRKVAAKTVSIQKAKNAGTTVAAMRDVTKGAKEQKGQNVIKAADEKNAKNAKSAKNVNTSQTAATTKNKKNTPKKYTFFQQIYRTLCYIGLKVQFKTYNSRRRVRRFFRPVAGTVASFLRHSVTQPVIGAFREFGAICSELRGISAGAADNARNAEKRSVRQVLALHKGFVAGVFNILLPILCIGVLLGVTLSITRSPHSLEVTCNGKVLGYIEDESVYNDALFLLRQRMPSSSEDYRSTFTPSYTVAAVSKSMNMSAETLCEAILADSQNVDNAYGLYIDGELCAAAKSYGDIQFIMQTFLDQYKTGTPGESVSFTGQTEIISGLFASDKIVSSQNFAKTISTKRTETQFYTVNDGDTAQSIANVANMSYERLLELNKSLTDTPQAGTSVLLEKELPVLSVQNVRTVTVKESIPFSKKTVKDDKQYTTYSKCVTQGQNGVREVMQQITEVNGVQVSCEVLSSTVVKAPVDAVYVVGTKKASKVGSGSFTWPVPGVRSISSPYGYRWGRLHRGIDISTSGIYGRTVVAADSGTVTVKNSAGGYGLHIIITHGNSYSTCYAHLSAVSVKSGQVVAKGQAIGKVGNSGHSTGPHLHFEIRKNNVANNPMNYF